MTKLNAKQMTLAYAGATGASICTGLAGGVVLNELGFDVNYTLVVSGTWVLTVGVPALIVANRTLMKLLGEKPPIEIFSNGVSESSMGRKVPINYKIGTVHTFLSSIPFPSLPGISTETSKTTSSVDALTVREGDAYTTVLVSEFSSFVFGCWDRYRANERHIYSRNYWTPKRFRLSTYVAFMKILVTIPNAILNRSQGRGGYPGHRPKHTIELAQEIFAPC